MLKFLKSNLQTSFELFPSGIIVAAMSESRDFIVVAETFDLVEMLNHCKRHGQEQED